MKKKLLATALLMLSIVFHGTAQVSINDVETSAHPSAILDVNSSNKGFLLPRLTTIEISSIYDPANGLIVFNTDNSRFYFYDGIANEWKEMAFGTNSIFPPTTVVEVLNPVTGRTWMDRNLGASQVATSSSDSTAYGDLYQWGRLKDGHEKRISDTTTFLSYDDSPGHSDFILTSASPYDWRNPGNDSLWQGLNGVNNPCPAGFRIPTEAEWQAERVSWSSNDAAGAFNSPLKLTVAGYRHYNSGSLIIVGGEGFYWASDIYSSSARHLNFKSSANSAGMYTTLRSQGLSIRCIKDEPIPNQAPDIPSNPSPADSSTIQPDSTALSWTCSDPDGDTLMYDVYFGTSSPPPLVASGLVDTTSFYPGLLSDSTTYFWKIVVTDQTDTVVGPIWRFNTLAPVPWACGDSLFDTRDSSMYATVLIDTVCWMAENLNVGTRIDGSSSQTDNGTIEKYCYNDFDSICNLYGGLYQWDEMMQYTTTEGSQGLCPEGWYLPTSSEWTALVIFLGGSDWGGELKSTRTAPEDHPRWNNPNNGATNGSGFTAFPGGYRNTTAEFTSLGFGGYWYTSTQDGPSSAILIYIYHYDGYIFSNSLSKSIGFSVRCIKSDFTPPQN